MIWMLFFLMLETRDNLGVEVEWIEPHSAFESAGAQHGDIYHAWGPRGEPPGGQFDDMFDWFRTAYVQCQIQDVDLYGTRKGRPCKITVPKGWWGVSVRPLLPPKWFSQYHLAATKIRADTPLGLDLWRRLANEAEAAGRLDVAWWLNVKMGNFGHDLGYFQETVEATSAFLERRGWIQGRSQGNLLEPLFAYRLIRVTNMCRRAMGLFHEVDEDYYWLIKWLDNRLSHRLAKAEILRDNARLLLERQQFPQAYPLLQKARLLIRDSAPNSLLLSQVSMELAIYHDFQGNLNSAVLHAMDAWALLTTNVSHNHFFLEVAHIRGVTAFNQNQFDLAEHFFKISEEFEKKTATPGEKSASLWLYQGKIKRAQGDFQAALRFFLQSKNYYEQHEPENKGHAYVHTNLGWLMGDLQDWETAAYHHLQALEIHTRRSEGIIDIIKVKLSLGFAYHQLDQLELAESYYLDALVGETPPQLIWIARGYHDLAMVQKKLFRPQFGLSHMQRALEIMENQIQKASNTALVRARFSGDFKDLYDQAVDFMLELGFTEEAFDLHESTRARLQRAAGNQRDPLNGLPSWFQKEMEALNRRLNHLYLASLTQPKTREITDELSRVRLKKLEYQEREAAFRGLDASAANTLFSDQLHRDKNPEDTSSPKRSAAQARNELCAVMPRDSLLVSYHLTRNGGHIFTMDHKGDLGCYPMATNSETMFHEIADYRRFLSNGNSDLGLLKLQSRHLYRLLLGPIEHNLSKYRRLVMIPDGSLHQLPFSTLQGPSGRWLFEEKALAHFVSLDDFIDSRKRTATVMGDIIAFADPDYHALQERRSPPWLARAIRNGKLSQLPHTRDEAKAVAALFPGRVTTFLGAAATERNLLKCQPGAGAILHFACHAFADFEYPLASGLVLSLPDRLAANAENGLVQGWEILERAQTEADLVVLSACETGVGRIVGNEGMLGLAQLFRFKGVRSVLASFWSVTDGTTAVLIEDFYRNLKAGLDKSEALRLAQKKMSTTPITLPGTKRQFNAGHPFFWGAFQLNGPWN